MHESTIESYLESMISKCVTKEIGKLLPQLQHPQREEDKLLTIEELQDFMPEKRARQTIYGWVNLRNIPYEKHGKRLYFRKSAIQSWLANGRQS